MKESTKTGKVVNITGEPKRVSFPMPPRKKSSPSSFNAATVVNRSDYLYPEDAAEGYKNLRQMLEDLTSK